MVVHGGINVQLKVQVRDRHAYLTKNYKIEGENDEKNIRSFKRTLQDTNSVIRWYTDMYFFYF